MYSDSEGNKDPGGQWKKDEATNIPELELFIMPFDKPDETGEPDVGLFGEDSAPGSTVSFVNNANYDVEITFKDDNNPLQNVPNPFLVARNNGFQATLKEEFASLPAGFWFRVRRTDEIVPSINALLTVAEKGVESVTFRVSESPEAIFVLDLGLITKQDLDGEVELVIRNETSKDRVVTMELFGDPDPEAIKVPHEGEPTRRKIPVPVFGKVASVSLTKDESTGGPQPMQSGGTGDVDIILFPPP